MHCIGIGTVVSHLWDTGCLSSKGRGGEGEKAEEPSVELPPVRSQNLQIREVLKSGACDRQSVISGSSVSLHF